MNEVLHFQITHSKRNLHSRTKVNQDLKRNKYKEKKKKYNIARSKTNLKIILNTANSRNNKSALYGIDLRSHLKLFTVVNNPMPQLYTFHTFHVIHTLPVIEASKRSKTRQKNCFVFPIPFHNSPTIQKGTVLPSMVQWVHELMLTLHHQQIKTKRYN